MSDPAREAAAAATGLLSDEAVGVAARLSTLHAGDRNVVAFTGVLAEDGSASVAAAVGVALAQMGHAVVVVDANLRAPSLHDVFALPRAPGLAERIDGTVPVDAPAEPSGVAGLDVVPGGDAGGRALPLLISSACADVLAALGLRYRYVLVDTPPLPAFGDAAAIAKHADGVVVALATGRRTHDDLDAVRRTLDGLAVPLSGVVLTEPARRRPFGARRSAA